MTVRIYLAAVQLLAGPPEPGDLPVERLFVDASDLPEVWVETERHLAPSVGRAVSFALARPLGLGFERVVGTVERSVDKQSKERVGDGAR